MLLYALPKYSYLPVTGIEPVTSSFVLRVTNNLAIRIVITKREVKWPHQEYSYTHWYIYMYFIYSDRSLHLVLSEDYSQQQQHYQLWHCKFYYYQFRTPEQKQIKFIFT